jgi:hypothetical protein
MHQRHWKFTQETATSSWEVNNVPSGAVGAVITHIETSDGQILQPDNQIKAPYGIQLSFGVQAVSGVAYGDYYVEEQDGGTTTVTGDGGIINVTVHQNNGAPRSQQ